VPASAAPVPRPQREREHRTSGPLPPHANGWGTDSPGSEAVQGTARGSSLPEEAPPLARRQPRHR
jgi:hypothetical protein